VSAISPYLHILREAIWNDRKARLSYRKSNGEMSERIVDPLGLVAKAGRHLV
jgi:predicted DNA-binding transcriptional regulator YafY